MRVPNIFSGSGRSVGLRTTLLFLTLAWTASVQAESFRYFRFTPTALRDGDAANSVQLAEMEVYANGVLLKPESAFNPDGANPGTETPAESIDGNLATKWLDFNRGPLILDFGKVVAANSYRWATANDAWERDPYSWRLEGSTDNSSWTLLDERLDYSTPLDRFTFLPMLDFAALPQGPEIRAFTVQAGTLVSAQAIAVGTGTTVTLRWEVTGATSVRIDPVTNSVAGTGELTAVPTQTTAYTLVATNPQGESKATVNVLVDAVIQAVWINEIMASNSAGANAFVDDESEAVDWIEIYNPNPFVVDLGAYSLTTDTNAVARWTMPSPTLLEPDAYLIVFASGKNRAAAGKPLHTDFKLKGEGEFLALLDAQGHAVHEFSPAYPPQYAGISYGLTTSGNPRRFDYFTVPTPGAANLGSPGLPLTDTVVFAPASGTFTGSITVGLSTDVAGTDIRYTTDGTVPTAQSPLFPGRLVFTGSTQVRARLFKTGSAPGPTASANFVKLTADAAAFSSNLPVFILDNYGRGAAPNGEPLQENVFLAFATNATGRASLTDNPVTLHRAGISRRGSSTLGEPKGNYRLEFWDEANDDEDVSLLGLPKDPDWILTAPYRFDRSLVRVPFMHQLSLNIGQYASHSVLVELFLNSDNNEVSLSDYAGVYVLQERISRGKDRVDVERLDPTDVTGPDVTGGYILSIDRSDSPTESFRTSRGTPTLPPQGSPRPWFNYIYPKAEALIPPQREYIQGYLDLMENALYSPQFTNPASGYNAYLDTDAFINHHLLIVLSKDPDALRLSTYLNKPRSGKLRMGPIWDFDRSMGGDSDGRAHDPIGWDPAPENAGFFTYDWWGRLFEDPDFWQRWIDRWQTLRQGPMSDTALAAVVESLAGQLGEAQVRNFERWPAVAPNGGEFSTQSGWPGEVEHLSGWLTRRAAWMDSQFPAPPKFAPASGQVSAGTGVTLSAPNPIYYTTDGSDPRLLGGGISGQAQRFEAASQSVRLLRSDASLVAHVPTADEAAWGLSWAGLEFKPTGWSAGTNGVGYDTATTYLPLIGLDVSGAMRGSNTSVYIRIPFAVDQPGTLDSLTLLMRYDDGFIAYLNGTRVAAANAPADPQWHSVATSDHADSSALQFESFNLNQHLALLHPGANVMAIHGLNNSLSSSDFLIQPELHATVPTSSQPIVVQTSTTFAARSFDGTFWSSLVRGNFVTTSSASSSNLVVSEIQYHPEGPSETEAAAGFEAEDFEFIELLNAGTTTVDLHGVALSEGIQFQFNEGQASVFELSPGARLVLVNQLQAFQARYTNQLNGVQVAGVFDGNLSNDGDHLRLTAIDGSVIHDFTYDDQLPWPVAADGEGYSLVLRHPTQQPVPDHNDPAQWRSSGSSGGSPGHAEGTVFVGDPHADLDHNGQPDFLDYALGFTVDPQAAAPLRLSLETMEVGGATGTYAVVTFTQNPLAGDATVSLQVSSDLQTWSKASAELTRLTDGQAGPLTLISFRSSNPMATGQWRFIRLMAE